MSCTLSPIHSAKRIVGAACIIRDITERKRVEQAAGRLAAIVESSQDAIISKTVEGVIISWNAAAQRIYGYSAAEAVGRHISILSPHGREHENAQLLARVAAGERVNHLETVRRRKDGSLIDVSLTVSPVRDHAGRIVGISAIGRDFTEHKRAERELERLAQAAEHGTDSVISTDLQGRICHWSQGAERLYGFTAQEAIGHTVEHLSHSAENPQSDNDRARALSRMLAGERGYQLETQSRRRDGRVVELLIKFTPWKVDGRIVGVTTVTNDITERKQIERARERALADLEEAQRIARVGSWTWDPGSDEASWSAQMYEIFARDPSHGPATGESFFELVAAEDREVTRAGYTQVFGGGPSFTLDYRVLAGGGVTRAVHAVGHEEPARPGCYLGTVQDVSEQRAAERALREAQERFRLAFEEAPIGMAVISADGTLEYANAALGIICGRLRHELHGLRLWELIHPADSHSVREALKALSNGDLDKLVRELRVMPASGSPVEVSIHATVLRYGAEQPDRLLCQFQDITERKQYESRLQFMADHDPLTGLMNRRKFEAELDRHVEHVKRYGSQGALLMLDIDNFKAVNDTLGHNAGDELIISIAGVLSQRVRASDLLARLGGDEFAVLLPRAEEAEAARVADALVSAVRENAALLGGQRQKVTTSVGIAMFNATDSALTGESAMIEGDLAMYDAKDNGRNRYAFYTNADHLISRTKARLTWVTRIEQALASDRFALVAQPILDLRSNQIGQHELLLRMLDEHDDMIPPAAFLYLAERFELIAGIDQWVVAHAIELIEQHPELRLHVDIFGKSLGDQKLLGTIDERLRASSIDPHQLIFEVTETAAVANITHAQAFVQRLRDHGCRFALDDFGAGFGSFYYLKHLPVDYVKIDGEFIQNAISGRIDQLVIDAVVRIAQGLGNETIAEFVTNEQTQRMITRLGVDHAQGYHIGRPIPIPDLPTTRSPTPPGSSPRPPAAQ